MSDEQERSAGQDQSLEDIRAERDRLQAELSLLKEALLAERREHRLTRSHFEDLNRQITEVFDSTSWKAGAPIRALGTVRRRSKVVAHLVQGLNRRRLTTLWRLLRQGDLATIRQRLTVVGRMSVPAVRIRHRRSVDQEIWPSDKPLVSVVVVCFNYGRFVAEAVESVLRQTAPRVEVIIIDGGSDDDETVKILHDLAADWPPQVRTYFRQGRHLVGDNRNFGIEHAQGKYICCLDADDRLSPIYLEVALFLLENHAYDLVSTFIGCFGLSDEVYGVLPFPDLEDMTKGNNVSTVGVFRRSDWERSGGHVDTGLAHQYTYEDWRFWMRLAALGARIANIEQALFHYRRHGVDSISNQAGSVVDMTLQRTSILSHNSDVLTPEAATRSRRRKETEIEVADGTVNLVPPDIDHRFTILLALPFFLVGGAERLVSGVIRSLCDHGIRVVVITTVRTVPDIDGDSTEWFTSVTDEVYQLPLLLEERRWPDFIRYLISSRQIDVLWLVGSEFVYRLLPELRMEFRRLGVVDQLFNTGVHARNNRRQRNWIDVTLVENEEVEDWLLTDGVRPEKVERIASAVDTSRMDPLPAASTGKDGPAAGWLFGPDLRGEGPRSLRRSGRRHAGPGGPVRHDRGWAHGGQYRAAGSATGTRPEFRMARRRSRHRRPSTVSGRACPAVPPGREAGGGARGSRFRSPGRRLRRRWDSRDRPRRCQRIPVPSGGRGGNGRPPPATHRRPDVARHHEGSGPKLRRRSSRRRSDERPLPGRTSEPGTGGAVLTGARRFSRARFPGGEWHRDPEGLRCTERCGSGAGDPVRYEPHRLHSAERPTRFERR